jgi:spermidine synthase
VDTRSTSRNALLALSVLFFFSGLSALIYQVLWLRMLGWVFGVTVYAASAVWATFMGGLAVGSVVSGRLADRIRQPLKWFAAAESLIAVTALATPVMLAALQQAYVALYPHLPHSPVILTVARLCIGVVVLIVPTALMGATLPFVLKASIFQRGALAAQVGVLYGSNAAGAIVGTVVSGLALIPQLGLQRTFWVAAACNLGVALAALALNSRVQQVGTGEADAGTSEATASGGSMPLSASTLRTILWVFTLSGAISMAMEVVWFRVITMIVRPTVYSFAMMLATLLGGIAIGSYAIAPLLARRLSWIGVLALLEVLLSVLLVSSFRPLQWLPQATESLGWMSAIMPAYLIHPLAASLLTILPAALVMGVAFPIGLRLWTVGGDPAQAATRVGVFYSLNVGGSIVGSLLAGFVLLPWLGSRTTLIASAAVTLVAALALVVVSGWRARSRWAVAAPAVVAFGMLAQTMPDPYDEFIAQRYPQMDPVWKEEGTEATVGVHEFGTPQRRIRMMTINGNHQAGTDGPTTIIHRRIGHLPMLVHPDARRALVIGMGGGATPGAVSIHDGVDVDVVELAEGVVNAAPWFSSINYDIATRPNVTIRVDDGRNFLLLTRDRFDVVTADVIQPVFAGAGNIYSREYFELVRNVLKDEGLVMQWIPGTEAEFKLIGRTFLSVFPHTTAWAEGNLFIGSKQPLRLSRENFEGRAFYAGRRQAMADTGIDSFDALLKTFVAGPDQLRAFLGDGPLLTDDRPMAEYFLSLPRDRQADFNQIPRGDVRHFVVDGAGATLTERR